MNQYDKGFAAGLAVAANVARRAADEVRLRPNTPDFGRRAKKLTTGALVALADSIEEAIQPRPPVPAPSLTVDPDCVGPLSERPRNIYVEEPSDQRSVALAKGYTGDECRDCGNFTLVRNGTCLKCETCGGTTGCS